MPQAGAKFSLPGSLPTLTQSGGSQFSMSPASNTAADQQPLDLVQIPPAFTQMWGIYTVDGEPLFDVDTCVDIKFGDASTVSDFPVEAGGFASYNKVMKPYQPKVKISVSGQTRIQSLLIQLQSCVRNTALYKVFTPEMVFDSVTLESYDYVRSQKNGRNLLQVEVTLKQVIEVTPAYSKTHIPPAKAKNAGKGDKAVGGKVQTTPAPTIYQQNNAMARQLGGSDIYSGVGTGGL